MPLYFALAAASVTTIGLLAVAARSAWSLKYANLFALAAGGMLVSLVILHIAPEALATSARAPLFILIGFFGGLLLHYGLRNMVSGRTGALVLTGVMPVVAIGLHSFLDGAVYTVMFAHSVDMGLRATLALILHEFPEGVIAFALMRGAGASNRTAFVTAFLAAGLTTPLGAAIFLPFSGNLDGDVLGELFALSAGLLLFVGTGPLLAHLETERPVRSFPALAAGIALAAILSSNHFHGDHPIHSAGEGHCPGDGHDHGFRFDQPR